VQTQGAFLEKAFIRLKETDYAFPLYALLIVLIFVIGLLCAVPPISKDALIHHLAVPKLYLNHGGMYEIPSMVYSYYPMNLQMLYMAALYLGSDIAPKFIHFSFALLTAWLVFGYLKQRLSAFYGLIGAVFFLSIPVIVKLSITAYIDLGLIFFSTASILLIFKWVESGFRPRHLILSAVFCGIAMGTKYNGLVVCCILTLFVPFVYSRFNRNRRFAGLKAVRNGAVFLAIALLLFSPWAIRNWHWTGNPIYPLYSGFFSQARTTIQKITNPSIQLAPTAAENSSKATEYKESGPIDYRSVIYQETPYEIALLPIRVFFQGRDGDPKYFGGKLNPFLLILPFFAFWRIERFNPMYRWEIKALAWFSALFFLIALFTTVMRIRYIAPIIPPLVILSVFGVHNIRESIQAISDRWKKLTVVACLGGVVIACLAYNAAYLTNQYRYVQPIDYLSGNVSRHEYIAKYRFEYPAMRYVNENLPFEAKILFFFLGKRGYYCDREYVPESQTSLFRFIQSRKTPEDILNAYKAMKATHLLVQKDFFAKWANELFNADQRRILQDFMQGYLNLEFSANGVDLLVLKASSGNISMTDREE